MDSKIDTVKSLLLALPGAGRALRGWANDFPDPPLPILAYHRVVPVDPATYPFDEEIVSAHPREFDRQMEYVAAHHRVLTFRDIDEIERRGDPLPMDALVVTFDDGYRDNHRHAFPILRKHGLRAVVYPATDYVEDRSVFWFERVSCYVKRWTGDRIDVDALGYHAALPARGRKVVVDELLAMLKGCPDALRRSAMEEMDARMGKGGVPERELVDVLTWDEIREMGDAGFEIGSHTCSHPVLANLPLEELRRELRESRALLERRTGVPVVSVSYPVGTATAVNPAVEAEAEGAGYRYGVRYAHGINAGLRRRFGLNRIRVETDLPFRHFRLLLSHPRCFFRPGVG